jgi:O-antigen/teichoic acid export membrane protein
LVKARGSGATGVSKAPRSDDAGLTEIASGATLNLGGAAISAAATLGLTILVTRHFGRAEAGAFFAATSLFLIVEAVANLGAYNGAIYFIARLRSLHEESRIPAILREAIIPVAVVSVAAAAAMLVFAEPLARGLLGGHLTHGADPATVARALRALAAAVPFAALADTFLGASRGYRVMQPTVFVDRVGRSCLQLLGVLGAALAGSAALLAPLWALPYVPAAIIGCLWLRRIHRHKGTLVVPPAEPVIPAIVEVAPSNLIESSRSYSANARGFWRFTAPRALASVAQIIIQRLDIVLVAILRGPVDAAVYTAATRFLVVGQLGNAAISMASQPQVTHLFAVRDRRGANAVYQATTAWLILLTWPLYLLAIIYGPKVLAVFGHSYSAGSTVMVILGLAMLVATGCGQVDMVLITTGRSSWSLANGLLAVAVNVSVDLILIPKYGITGAAIGWAAAIGLTNLVPLLQVAKVVRVHPFGFGSGVACVLTTLSFCVIPLTLRAVAGGGALVSGIALAAGCALMAAGLWRFRDALQLAVIPGLARAGRRKPGTRSG